ncbi:MAG: hypothetical protein PHX71_10450 [Synergistales bacterium]|nr:hypothetical protein [Synergistales bacterium]
MKSLLLSGIVKSDPSLLAESIVLWDEMSLIKKTFKSVLGKAGKTAEWDESNPANKFIKYFIGETSRGLEKKLQEQFVLKVQKNTYNPPFVSQWLLLKRIFDIFEISLPKEEVSRSEMDRLCMKIEGLFLSDFARSEKLDKPTDLVGFFNFYIEKMAETLISNFSKLSKENQDKALDSMLKKIKEMPQDQKEAFRSSLQLDGITRDSLRKAILAGSASVGLTSYVSFAGFGAYILLTKMISSVAGIVGLTLPFGVFTSATSLLAVLSSPLTMILFLSGGGVVLEKRAAKEMKKEFLKGLMAQMVFTAKTQESSWKDMRCFLEARKVAELYVN